MTFGTNHLAQIPRGPSPGVNPGALYPLEGGSLGALRRATRPVDPAIAYAFGKRIQTGVWRDSLDAILSTIASKAPRSP